MSIGSFEPRYRQQPMADINVVPLVDVMLVLLVIFIITAPLLTHSVKIDLPRASSTPNQTRPEHIELALKQDGQLFWNGEVVTPQEIGARFAAASRIEPQPELHIRADRLVSYEKVAQVMSGAASAGLVRIGFVTEPVR